MKKVLLGIKKMKELGEDLKAAPDKKTFLWAFIESQIQAQPVENLIDLRRLINKTIARKLRERDKDADGKL